MYQLNQNLIRLPVTERGMHLLRKKVSINQDQADEQHYTETVCLWIATPRDLIRIAGLQDRELSAAVISREGLGRHPRCSPYQ
jgi:hypothetical protein